MMKYVALTICLFILISCDHYSESMNQTNAPDFMYVNEPTVAPQTFKDYLAIEYYNLARYEQTQTYDYVAARRYINKGNILLSGRLVSPEEVHSLKLSEGYKTELITARKDLISNIKNYALPENRAALALAQTRFDCWVDQAKEWPDQPERLTCKNQFFENMSKVNKYDLSKHNQGMVIFKQVDTY